jgi:hypothetical protein
MNGDQLPVDLWVHLNDNEDAHPYVQKTVTALFGDEFEWIHDGKGVASKIDAQTADLAQRVLNAVGAAAVIDEEAYADPGMWLSPITPEQNRRDAFVVIGNYLDDPRGARGGTLRIALLVTQEGMIRRLAHNWQRDYSTYAPFEVWDVIG